MQKHIYAALISLVTLTFFIAGCTLPIPQTPVETTPDPENTAAVQTIAAQLSQVVGSITDYPQPEKTQATPLEGTPEGTDVSNLVNPSETFPPTSTPLPTNTPLPSDTPTITLTPTITPIPSNTPIPSATSTDPKAQLGEPDFRDQFTSNTGWAIYNDEHVEIQIQDGNFTLTALNPDGYEAMLLREPVLSDFYLEVTATPGECLGGDRYGLLARAPGFSPIQTYVFEFTCDGRYSLRIWDGSKFNAIVNWTPSPHINRGSNVTNVLGFMVEGSTITLFANGNLLMEVVDETFTSGFFGVVIGSVSTPDFTVEITEVAYWELP